MTDREATAHAQELIRQSWGCDARVLGAKRASEDPSKWGIAFETVLTDGTIVDGPTVVIVDDATGEAQFLSEYFEARRKARDAPPTT